MRKTWKGRFECGLISFGVGTVKATKREGWNKNTHERHKGCGGRVGRKKYCKEEDEIIEWNDTFRSYDFGNGDYIKLGSKEMEKLEKNLKKIEVLGTVDKLEEMRLGRKKYFLIPNEEADKEIYKNFLEALRELEKILIAKWNYHQRDRLVAIKVKNDKLCLYKLIYGEKIKDKVMDLEIELPEGLDKEKFRLIKQYIKENLDKVDLDEIESDYGEKFKELIKKKRKGEKVVEEEEEEGELKDKLRKAIKEKVKAK